MKLLEILRNIYNATKIAKQSSYFPEKERKPYVKRLYDNFIWSIRFGEYNRFYNLYGLDIKGEKNCNYKDYCHFAFERDRLNKLSNYSYNAILRDKFIFYRYMSAMCQPVPEVFAVWFRGRLYDSKMNLIPEKKIADRKDYFIKSIDGECADFVKHIGEYGDFCLIKKNLRGGVHISKQSNSM